MPIPRDPFTEMALDFAANPLPVSLFKPAVLIGQGLSIPHNPRNLTHPSSQPIHTILATNPSLIIVLPHPTILVTPHTPSARAFVRFGLPYPTPSPPPILHDTVCVAVNPYTYIRKYGQEPSEESHRT